MQMTNEIKIGDANALQNTIQSYLKELGVNVETEMIQACDEVGKEAANMLKGKSPRSKSGGGRHGHYADGWKYTRKSRNGNIIAKVYNGSKPGLAHLLEKGHEKVDPTGKSHGKTKAQPHISDVDRWVQEELPRRFTQKLNKKL